MAKSENIDGANNGILVEKLEICISILEGRKEKPSRHLQKFYNEIKSEEKEEVLSEMINLYLNFCYSEDDYTSIYRSKIFELINSKHASTFSDREFVVNNLIKIIKLAFKHEPLEYGLIELIENLAEENESSLQGQENGYKYVKDEYREISGEIERLEKVFAKHDINKLYSFFNFIYETKKSIEEQDKAKELERQKAEQDLLSSVKKVQSEPQQQKKKRNKSKNGKNPAKIQSDADTPEVSNDKEVPVTDDKVVEEKWSEKLLKLRDLGFPVKESKEFEEEIRQGISVLESEVSADACNKKIEQLYNIMIDFYLLHIKHSIRDYSNRYGQIIEKTKDLFGTSGFDYESNKFITKNLCKIASCISKINGDLKEARLTLDKVTPLVYEDYHNKLQDNRWLEITGSDNLKLLSEFLDHLKDLGEWHNNKLKFVSENNIKSNRTKTDAEKARERNALRDIASCVSSIDKFINIYTTHQSVLEASGNASQEEADSEGQSCWQHQPWCYLSHTKIESVIVPSDSRHCSC